MRVHAKAILVFSRGEIYSPVTEDLEDEIAMRLMDILRPAHLPSPKFDMNFIAPRKSLPGQQLPVGLGRAFAVQYGEALGMILGEVLRIDRERPRGAGSEVGSCWLLN